MKSLYRVIIFGILVNLFGGSIAATLAAESANQNSSYIEVSLASNPTATFTINATRQRGFGGGIQDDTLKFTKESNGKYISDPINHLSGVSGASINCSPGPTPADNTNTTQRDTYYLKITDNATQKVLDTNNAVFCNQPFPSVLGVTLTPSTPAGGIDFGSVKGTFKFTSDAGGTKPFQHSATISATRGVKNIKYTLAVDDNGQIIVNGKVANMQLPTGLYQLDGTYIPGLPSDGQYSRFIKTSFTVTKNVVLDISAVAVKSTELPPADPAAAADPNQIQCDGGGLTWVICPLIIGASKTIDGSKAILQNLLIVQPLSGASTDATYAIWKNIRNFADIIFVLIFLVVIFGTSFGLDNYTVKKTLPRLIAAAILVQFSYFLAGFVIDIGNVLGGGMEALATASGIKAPLFDFAQGGQVGGLVLAFSAAGLLAVGAIMLSFTAIIGAVIAILVVILSLIARQILISLLIILSPIAMVMWVLPNTEKGFKLWYKSLFQVVMLYPIIMLLFIAGRLFSVAATATHQSEVFAVIGYILPLFLVPMAFKSAGTLFNLASKGVGKVGGLANSQVGRGSNFDKKRAENRQYNSAQRAGEAKTAFGRSINSKRAGFGFAPSPLQQSAMAGVVKKGDTARLDMADRKLENLNADQLKATALSSSSSALTKRAAVSRLAEKSDTGALTEILASGALGSQDASHPEWQKAIGSKASDLVKTAPHLVMPDAGATKMYQGMGAESVVGLSAAGFEKWKTATNGTSRQQDIARTVASSAPLTNKITEERRVELNTAAGGSMAGGETHYIPTSRQAQEKIESAKAQEVAAQAAAAQTQTVNEAYGTNKALGDLHAVINDPSMTSEQQNEISQHYVNNPLYKQAVDHAVITGGVVPAPPARPVTTKIDPMSQGEVKIPGDDRSVS